jgi:hypothetical protein
MLGRDKELNVEISGLVIVTNGAAMPGDSWGKSSSVVAARSIGAAWVGAGRTGRATEALQNKLKSSLPNSARHNQQRSTGDIWGHA